MKKSFLIANSMLTTGIVLALIGVMAIICGEDFFGYLLKMSGAIIAVASLALLIVRLAKRNTDSTFQRVVMILMVACTLVCGSLIFYFAEELTHLFVIIIGALILLGAIMMIIINLAYHTSASKVSRVYLILSIIVLVACALLGVIFIKNPDLGNLVMAVVLGALMIFLGALFVLESFKVRKSIKDFNKKILQSSKAQADGITIDDAEIIEEIPNK